MTRESNTIIVGSNKVLKIERVWSSYIAVELNVLLKDRKYDRIVTIPLDSGNILIKQAGGYEIATLVVKNSIIEDIEYHERVRHNVFGEHGIFKNSEAVERAKELIAELLDAKVDIYRD